MATLICPGCAAEVGLDDLICFTCGANLPRPGQAEDAATPPTVMQEYIRRDDSPAMSLAPAACPHCSAPVPDRSMATCPACSWPLPRTSGPISPVVLRLTFPAGNVDVPAGTSLVLGRDPGESLVAAAFAQYENVSRRHATVIVSDSGQATIRDERSTNGTFVNGDRVLPGTEVRLEDGDSVRLGADVSAEVSLPRTGLDGAGFAANGHSANGHSTNGHSANGHSANGHSANGHSANGHSANGHSPNRHNPGGYTPSPNLGRLSPDAHPDLN